VRQDGREGFLEEIRVVDADDDDFEALQGLGSQN
jgi:hypothetical protein